MDAYQIMSETKAALQVAFRQLWNKNHRKGAAGAATGMGKTKPAIDEMWSLWMRYHEDMVKKEQGWSSTFPIRKPRIMVVVPTEDLRDVNWPAEVEQWYGPGGMEMWHESVKAVCYASLHKFKSIDFDLVILDEMHNLTMLSASFFNSRVDVMGLTATYPDPKRDPDKWLLCHQVCPEIFTYTLDQGVDDGVVADFDLHIVWVPLDTAHKNIECGPAGKRYFTTEADRYRVLTNVLKRLHAEKKDPKFMELARRSLLCNLPSKLKAAQAIMKKVVIPGKRTMIFCGSIKQADELVPETTEQGTYHSKKSKKKGAVNNLEEFRAGRLQTLGVVAAVNEGANIPNIDQGIIVQLDSNERTLVQRLGRLVRWREGYHAQIWVLVTPNTADQQWAKQALANFSADRISYHKWEEFLST